MGGGNAITCSEHSCLKSQQIINTFQFGVFQVGVGFGLGRGISKQFADFCRADFCNQFSVEFDAGGVYAIAHAGGFRDFGVGGFGAFFCVFEEFVAVVAAAGRAGADF